MTVVVLWEQESAFWCAADSRISGTATALTDSGAKILPLPVNCWNQDESGRYRAADQFSLGFAFAGSTLSALSSLAIASACTQNLGAGRGKTRPPSVQQIAELFKTVAEHYVRDAAFRAKTGMEHAVFFDAMLFGWCRVEQSLVAFAFASTTAPGYFRINMARYLSRPGGFLPMGSGARDFAAEIERSRSRVSSEGVIGTLARFVGSSPREDVGGHLQVGIANHEGFGLRPILAKHPGSETWEQRFLGLPVDFLPPLGSYTIGFEAVAPTIGGTFRADAEA